MKILNTIILVSFLSLLMGQGNSDPWNTLAMVDKESKFDDMMGMVVQKAFPKDIVKPLHGQEMEIKGYIIALAAKTQLKHFMFSRYPQNMCFFCGAAGPESAMQVFMKSGQKVDFTSDKVVIRGTFNIQKDDPSGLIYTLQNAELVEVLKSK